MRRHPLSFGLTIADGLRAINIRGDEERADQSYR
jgi:hypothetical protein